MYIPPDIETYSLLYSVYAAWLQIPSDFERVCRLPTTGEAVASTMSDADYSDLKRFSS
jgi:hypothetical protein